MYETIAQHFGVKERRTYHSSSMRVPYHDASEALVVIYCLSDPRNGQVKYVGKTRNTASRFRQHLSAVRKSYVTNWIKGLLVCGLEPIMEELEALPEYPIEAWQEAERFWIEYLRFAGCKLSNLDAGGINGHSPSPETRIKIGLANKGKVPSAEKREKLRIAKLGWHHSPETRLKMSLSRKGKKLSAKHVAKLKAVKRTPEWLSKLSVSQKGKIITPETRAKISKTLMGHVQPRDAVEKTRQANLGAKRSAQAIKNMSGRPCSEENRERIRNLNLGKKMSPEQIEKLRISHLGKKQSPETVEKRRVAMILHFRSVNPNCESANLLRMAALGNNHGNHC